MHRVIVRLMGPIQNKINLLHIPPGVKWKARGKQRTFHQDSWEKVYM